MDLITRQATEMRAAPWEISPLESFRSKCEDLHMEPYIKASSPLRGAQKPGLKHGPGLPKIEKRQRVEVAATRRALKKAARRVGKQEIAESE